MNRIIRSNAVEASSQSKSLEINQQDVHPCYNLTSEMASIYGGSVASAKAAFSELPTNTQTAKATIFQAGITSTNNCCASLQKLLEQPPSVLPRLILLGSLAFFITVVAWAFTGKIQQVSQVRGKFVPLGELYQLQPREFGKVVKFAVKQGQQIKAGQVVAELDTQLLVDDLEVKKQQLKQIQALLHQTDLTATTVVAPSALKEQAGAETIVSPQIPLAVKQQLLTQLQADITQLQTKITETKTSFNKAKAEPKSRFVYAPIDGVVSSLNVSSTGEVVQPGQTIAEIVPNGASLVLVITLPAQKVDFVNQKDKVEIKLNADNSHSYLAKALPKAHTGQEHVKSIGNDRILLGRIASISPDIQPDEKLGWVYRVEVALDRNQTMNLKAGQAATAQIIHHRRVADMFLEPIKKLQNSQSNL